MDIMVLPGTESTTGLAEGSDLLAQEFLLSLLNYEQAHPYLPVESRVPLASLMSSTGNMPSLQEAVSAFNISVPLIKITMQEKNPEYLSAVLEKVSYTEDSSGIVLNIQLLTTTGSIYVNQSFTFGLTNV